MTEKGRAPCQEKPGPRARKRTVYRKHQDSPQSTFEFSLRTALALTVFAAWVAAIIGAFVLIGYGTVLGLAAVAGTDPRILRVAGLAILAVIVASLVAFCARAVSRFTRPPMPNWPKKLRPSTLSSSKCKKTWLPSTTGS